MTVTEFYTPKALSADCVLIHGDCHFTCAHTKHVLVAVPTTHLFPRADQSTHHNVVSGRLHDFRAQSPLNNIPTNAHYPHKVQKKVETQKMFYQGSGCRIIEVGPACLLSLKCQSIKVW